MIPSTPPNVDVRVLDHDIEAGTVQVRFTSEDTGMEVDREYQSMDHATSLAVIFAVVRGVSTTNPMALVQWLRDRGFTGQVRMP